ncbi:GNAT family N-acetyltransferase [Marinomonas transparens]|uniref:N-acetyltransferase n=1 Tax=Marinomonas transparens TaxID=2795388 RepID=A0A934MVM8_9GAMM|nr:N-acetyltransferase [Marinomonas transparens]MBJ7537219.1 N-acetyltransferase [Marinomonas transparens]
MKFSLFSKSESQSVIDLFKSVFSASEGEAEGQVIADFVSNLITTTKPQDLIGCIAEENEVFVGCIFFSRFTVPSGTTAFILSPVAVSTNVQGTGIGQKLIQYGLDYLSSQNVNLVFTYGNPSYYSKTGFAKINENIVKAPYPLSQPIGWLAQSLDGKKIEAIAGPTQCVEALNNPDLW